MSLKIQKVMSVVLLAAFISGSAFALKPEKPEVRENLTTWTRTTENGNEWIEGEGGSVQCLEADRVCQYQFPEGYNPNEHGYNQNMTEGDPLIDGVLGYKPL